MSSFVNEFDELETLIYKGGLRIKAIHFHQDIDMMLIVLNNKKVFQHPISVYARLKKATYKQLCHYKLIGGGTGVHWPDVDEDLSLKGFLRDEIKNSIRFFKQKAA